MRRRVDIFKDSFETIRRVYGVYLSAVLNIDRYLINYT